MDRASRRMFLIATHAQHPYRRILVAEAISLLLILVWGAWIRLENLARGPTSDEISFLKWRGLSWIYKDSLNRLHPPFFRMSVTAWNTPEQALMLGRFGAFLAGMLAIVLVWILARRSSNSRIAALLAAAALAALPPHILFSALFRPYAALGLLMATHLLALSLWVAAPERKTLAVAVAATALLIPQVHYIGAPWLALTGLGVLGFSPSGFRRLWVYIPSALALLPLLDPITKNLNVTTGSALPNSHILRSFEHLLGMGLRGPPLKPFLGEMWPISIAAVLAIPLFWRHIQAQLKVIWIGCIAMGLSVLWVAPKHHLAPSTQLLAAPMLIVLVASLPWVLTARSRRFLLLGPLALVAIMGSVGMMLHHRLDYQANHSMSRDRIALFLDQYGSFIPKNHAVRFVRASDTDIARFKLTGSVRRENAIPTGCPNVRCFKFNGHFWLAKTNSPWPHASVWVSGIRRLPTPLPPGCTLIATGSEYPELAICDAGVTHP